uniref:Reticulon-like protein n=1 Tax=Oryza minuta TaxID=63629 RepID=G9C332_ORYMI|nr:putative reticulon [Oryza minuta]
MATTSRRSLHALLGGGAVADVVLWRRRNVSAAAVAGATAVWFLFERAGYSFPSVMANALLLLVAILFFWAKSASLLNRPLPPLPKLEVSDVVVEKAADRALVWINRVLAVGHDIAIKRDRSVFIKVILILWAVSYIGMLFNFLTLIYIGVMFSLLVPPLYEKYQDHVDEKIGMAHSVLSRHLDTIISKTGESTKQKKTE